MVVFDGNIERHAEAGDAVLHPAADRGLMKPRVCAKVEANELRRSPGSKEALRGQGLGTVPTRHPETRGQSGPKRKRNQQEPQTIAEFWDTQDDEWW